MAINTVIVDGSTGGTNTRVIRVLPQTTTTAAVTINTEANKGYILTGATLQTITLPFPSVVGDVFALHGKGVGLFRIVHQTTDEQITLGDKQNILGLSGTIESTDTGDELYLICTHASGKWKNDGGYGGTLLIDGVTPTNTINNVGGDGAKERGFVSMVSDNEWVGHSFSFPNSFLNAELIPGSATYSSILTPNVTSPANAELKYIGTPTKTFLVYANVAVSDSSAFAIVIAVNGITQAASEYYMGSGRTLSVSGFPVTLTTNDIVTIYSKRSVASNEGVRALHLAIVEV